MPQKERRKNMTYITDLFELRDTLKERLAVQTRVLNKYPNSPRANKNFSSLGKRLHETEKLIALESGRN